MKDFSKHKIVLIKNEVLEMDQLKFYMVQKVKKNIWIFKKIEKKIFFSEKYKNGNKSRIIRES